MSRPRRLEEDALIAALTRVFTDVGYEGASLARLSAATGLQKASLYHRFPGGKRQMAEEVLDAAAAWFGTHVIAMLGSDAPPAARVAAVAEALRTFYEDGQKACLLNMLSSPRNEDGPFASRIAAMIAALLSALAAVAAAAGHDPDAARTRAERTLTLLQGSLVLARGSGSTAVFRRFLSTLPDELLAENPR
jgi:AcrR family transcriptional regulator